MEALEAVYRLSGTERVRDRAEAILLEQTVETPHVVAERYAFVRDHMMGEVRRVDADPPNGTLITLSLPVVTASIDPAQFLNVLFGNSSLHTDVRLEDFTPPPNITAMLRGPRFGISGLRERTGVFDRPLTCSALKPVGATLEEIAGLCRNMAEGGLDLIKDDHYLADHPFARFDERVRVCQDVVEEVAARTGRRALYIPNLSGTPDDVKRQAFVAQRSGVGAVMAAPMLIGMPVFHQLCSSELEVPILAHPSFGGVQSIRPAALYGKLFRLFGADAVIFASYGGRFSFSAAVCGEIARALRTPWLELLPAFPTPAGGMDAARAAELVRFFGTDSILLVGGSLLEAADDLREKSARFTESVRHAALAVKRPD